MEQLKDPQCNCMEEITEKIKEKASSSPRNAKGYAIVEADFEYISRFPAVRLYSNFLIKYTFTKVDGSTSKPRNEHINIFYSFCPFCGKKYPKSE